MSPHEYEALSEQQKRFFDFFSETDSREGVRRMEEAARENLREAQSKAKTHQVTRIRA